MYFLLCRCILIFCFCAFVCSNIVAAPTTSTQSPASQKKKRSSQASVSAKAPVKAALKPVTVKSVKIPIKKPVLRDSVPAHPLDSLKKGNSGDTLKDTLSSNSPDTNVKNDTSPVVRIDTSAAARLIASFDTAPLPWVHAAKINVRNGFQRLFPIICIALAALGILVFMSLLFKKNEKRRFLTTTRLSIMDKEVQRACKYIEKNCGDVNLTPETVCAGLITGKAFLEILFERELGMSLSDFIVQVRINRARHFITLNPGAVAQEVATVCGFSDETAFTAAFEKLAQISFEKYPREKNCII